MFRTLDLLKRGVSILNYQRSRFLIKIDPDLLTRLYNECQGHIQPVFEILTKIIRQPYSQKSYLVSITY